ncbi:MAG: prepilin peptidase [Pseudomonadota bacterium]
MAELKLIVLIGVLSIALITDLWRYKIYNWLIVLGLLAGLLLQVYVFAVYGLWFWFKGVTVAFLAFIPLYLARGMAAGDVKLMMVVGGLLSFTVLIDALISTYIAGGLVALAYVLYRRQGAKLWQNIKNLLFGHFVKMSSGVEINDAVNEKNSVGKMPYALAICMGTAYALLKNGFNV